ncbi:MAG: sigma-70 family RNA polymerase sigma factor [Cytophagaceae bacterium]|nr:sigma-70 family RNA polymerase sigma factor [Cytophagaceae bacterium]
MLFIPKKDASKLSDPELISKYRSTDETIYAGELFQRYNHLVYGVCMKYLKNPEESRDAVMNIFEKLLEDLKKHEIGNFKGWLHTVARNHCLMFIRANKNFQKESEESLDQVMELSYSMHHYENETDMSIHNLDDCIKKLADEQKRCVELFYFEDKCYKEIAELTRYTLNEVKSFIQNGKRNLKNCLSSKNEQVYK